MRWVLGVLCVLAELTPTHATPIRHGGDRPLRLGGNADPALAKMRPTGAPQASLERCTTGNVLPSSTRTHINIDLSTQFGPLSDTVAYGVTLPSKGYFELSPAGKEVRPKLDVAWVTSEGYIPGQHFVVTGVGADRWPAVIVSMVGPARRLSYVMAAWGTSVGFSHWILSEECLGYAGLALDNVCFEITAVAEDRISAPASICADLSPLHTPTLHAALTIELRDVEVPRIPPPRKPALVYPPPPAPRPPWWARGGACSRNRLVVHSPSPRVCALHHRAAR